MPTLRAVSLSRYALRTVALAAAFLLVSWAATGPLEVFSPLAVAALWLVGQARAGLRRFDVIALGTTAAVFSVLQGTGMMAALVHAIVTIVPAAVFAVLLERWVPDWWKGLGVRQQTREAVLGRIAASAVLAASAAVVLQGVIDPVGFTIETTAGALARDAVTVLALTVGVRAFRQARRPRRPSLTVVR